MPEEQKINKRLSNWSALTRCPCGRWTFQASAGRSPEGICWERRGTDADAYRHPLRRDPVIPPVVRTWRATGAGAKRTFEFVGPTRCDGPDCNWDLTKSPRDNIAAMAPSDWGQGIIVGSVFAVEGAEPVDILPADVAITFARCNLDNVVLGDKHTMASTRDGGATCSHSRIHADSEGKDMLHNWRTGERVMSVQEAAQARLEARQARRDRQGVGS